jgi:hypothetical protein
MAAAMMVQTVQRTKRVAIKKVRANHFTELAGGSRDCAGAVKNISLWLRPVYSQS